MFKGFQSTGVFGTTVKTKQMFNGIPSTGFSQAEGIQGAIPTDSLVAWFNPQIIDSSTGITLNGSTVSSWKDTSGTYNLVQATAANQPTYVQSSATYRGRNYLSFDGGDSLSLVNNLGLGTNSVMSYFIILKRSNLTGANRFPLNFNTGAAGSISINSRGDAVFINSNLASSVNTAISPESINIQFYGFEVNRGAGFQYLHANGTYRRASSAITTTITDYSLGTFFISSTTAFYLGFVFDVLIYNKSLTQDEYINLYRYFNNLYGGI